jgi:hypothetical protein
MFSKFDINKMPAFGREKNRIQADIDKAMAKYRKNEIKIISLLDRILNILFDLNGPLMAVHV